MLHQILLGISNQGKWDGSGHVAHMEETRNAYRILVGKHEGKILLWRPRRR